MKKIIIASLIPLLLITVAIFNEYLGYVGYVTLPIRSAEDVLIDVKVMSADNSLKLLSNGTKICVVIEIDNTTTYYYELTKTDSLIETTYKYCADPNQNNVIIKFNSYDSFSRFKENPKDFIIKSQNIDYYVFPSNYVSQGGKINCNPDFQERYCGALYYYFSTEEMRKIGLDCCAEYSLPEEKINLINQLKGEKQPLKEKPFIFSGIGIAISIAVIVLLVVISSVLLRKPKIEPALKDYIENSISQGYSEEQIKKALVDAGWNEKDVDFAISRIKK